MQPFAKAKTISPNQRNISQFKKGKSNFYCARGITPKRATSCGARLRGSAPGPHSSKETRTSGNFVSDLTDPEIRNQNPRTDNDVLNHYVFLFR